VVVVVAVAAAAVAVAVAVAAAAVAVGVGVGVVNWIFCEGRAARSWIWDSVCRMSKNDSGVVDDNGMLITY
jgi:hypothetical protein